MADNNFNGQNMGRQVGLFEELEETPLFENFDDYPDAIMSDEFEDSADNIIFFDRQFLLIDGNDESISLMLTDDTNSPTLGQMLANGADGENFYAILDSKGEHIPMVRDVEILVTGTDQENADALKEIMCWHDLKPHGIEIDPESSAVTLMGWHLVDPADSRNQDPNDAINSLTTIYENGKGLRLETTLVNMPQSRESESGIVINSIMPGTQNEIDDLQTIIFLAQDGNC